MTYSWTWPDLKIALPNLCGVRFAASILRLKESKGQETVAKLADYVCYIFHKVTKSVPR